MPPPELPPVAGTPILLTRFEAAAPAFRSAAIAVAPSEGPGAAVFIRNSGEAGEIQQAAQVYARPKEGPDESFIFTVTTDLPGPERLFRRQSENEFFDRIRQESKGKAGSGRIIFPESPPLTKETYQRRSFPPMVESVEPSYVCHGRLFFEQPNFERQGWDLGVLTPVANLGAFYYDLALLPYHAWTRPFQQTDCSAGKCLPGDPTPFYLYPEEFSVTGLVGQAAVVTGLFHLFP